MKSIASNILKNTHTHSDLKELNIYDSSYLLENIESQIAKIEGGRKAIASKSFRSARFTLLKELAQGKPLRILSYEPPAAWNEDGNINKRYQFDVIFAHQYSEEATTKIIKLGEVDVVYVGSINSQTLYVENFSSLIFQTLAYHLPVIFDNTYGPLGAVYQPLVHHADFVITDTSKTALNQYGIGGYIAEGIFRQKPSTDTTSIFAPSTIEVIKNRRVAIDKKILLQDKVNFETRLHKEVAKQKSFSKNAFTLAKWLNQEELVMEVNYPGLKTSDSFQNAENHFNAGYGNVLKFSLWENKFYFNLLKSFFIAGKPAGLTISHDNYSYEFEVKIFSDSLTDVLSYLQRVFALLKNEKEYRQILKKQIKLQHAVAQILNS